MSRWHRARRRITRGVAATVAVGVALTVALPTEASTPPTTTAAPTTTSAPTTTAPAPTTTVAATTTAAPTTSSTTAPTSTVAPSTVAPTTTAAPTTSAAPTTTAPAPAPTTTAPAPTTTVPGATTTSTSSVPSTTAPDGGIGILQTGGTLGLVKEASVTQVSPGDAFTYTLVASCSGLTEGCVNAVLSDPLPADVDAVDLPADTPNYDVEYNAATRIVSVAFRTPLIPPDPPGSVGLLAGSSFNIEIGVRLRPESQVVNGSTLTNTGTLNDQSGIPATAGVDLPVVVPVVVNPVATKTWSDGSAIAGSDEPSVITLGVRNASSSSADVRRLVVEDSDPAVFERFDVTGVGAVTFPAGADRLVVAACTVVNSACVDSDYLPSPPQSAAPFTLPPGIAAADVTAVRFIFTNAAGAELPYDPSGGRVEMNVALRDTLRSTDAPYQPAARDTVQNCARPGATDASGTTTPGTPACVSFNVEPAQVTINATEAVLLRHEQ